MTTRRKSLRGRLDDIFATLARYTGILMFVYAAMVDRGANPALIPAAMGLVLYKSVKGDGEKD